MIEDAAVGIRLLTQENAISELRGQEVRVRWQEGQDAAPAELLAFGKPTVLERKRKKIVAAAASAEEIATASSTSVQGSGAASPVQQLCCSAALEMPELLAKIAELTAENEVLKRKLESAETTVGK
ncbi:uncharacterized protein LOC144113165 [Amblyomma americanum]